MKLANNLQIQPTHSPNGSQITQQGANGAIIPDKATEYERKATLYLYSALQSVYGQKYRITFKSEDELQLSRRQWASNIGELSREEIDSGIDRLKKELAADNPKFEWPDIGKFIGLCKRKDPGEIKPYQHPWELEDNFVARTEEEKKIDSQIHLGKIRSHLRRAKLGIHIKPGNDIVKR